MQCKGFCFSSTICFLNSSSKWPQILPIVIDWLRKFCHLSMFSPVSLKKYAKWRTFHFHPIPLRTKYYFLNMYRRYLNGNWELKRANHLNSSESLWKCVMYLFFNFKLNRDKNENKNLFGIIYLVSLLPSLFTSTSFTCGKFHTLKL